ncbi:MAG: dihydroorotase [Candidatus Cloacimonadota bacterium]|nr:MAG: dihydroorotase [Candidatus Cloacimonadota bacterium]
MEKSQKHKYVIKNGRIIDPIQGLDEKTDILIEGEKIKGLGTFSKKDGEIIDVKGLIVCPGFIDMHTHLREPGREDEETIETGTKAAAKGGFTGIAAMPNTEPIIDNSGMVRFVRETAERNGYVDVFPIGAVTKGQKGEELSEMHDMVKAGCKGFSDDGYPIANSRIMRKALEYSKIVDKVIIVHEEDPALCEGGQMNEDFNSTRLGLRGMPAIAESIMISRDAAILDFIGGRLHIAHLSTRESLEVVRASKKKGLPITAEVTPHHFSLDSSCLATFDSNLKMKPPLRTKEDVEALKKGLKEGIIDAIATDHAPHALFEKEMEFGSAPFGIIGLETALGIVCTELLHTGMLSLKEIIEKMSVNPAKILGIGKRSLKKGEEAYITVFDPEKKWTVNVDDFVSKSSNSPYGGWKLKGCAVITIVKGKIVYKEGEFF